MKGLFMLGLLAAHPAPQRYCPPVMLSDYNFVVASRPMLRVAPGCTRSALVRRTFPSGRPDRAVVIRPGETKNIWTITGRLQYSLDGVMWRKLGAR